MSVAELACGGDRNVGTSTFPLGAGCARAHGETVAGPPGCGSVARDAGTGHEWRADSRRGGFVGGLRGDAERALEEAPEHCTSGASASGSASAGGDAQE